MGYGDSTDQSLVVGFIHKSEFGDGFCTQIGEDWWLDLVSFFFFFFRLDLGGVVCSDGFCGGFRS